ncbi:unnamed protein product [Symbiodinium sp. CCMP2592]|nr:unnamed protein product [Symbiodinium sp. CCMP2592]
MEKPPFIGPVFVQNPDGSIAQGVPPGFKEPTPPDTPRLGVSTDMNFNLLSADIVKVLARHEALFLTLMVMHLGVVSSFQYIELQYKEDAVLELMLIYPDLDENSAGSSFRALCADSTFVSAPIRVSGIETLVVLRVWMENESSLGVLGLQKSSST